MAALQGPGSAAQGSPAELEVPQVTKVGVGVLLVKRPPEEGGEPLVLVGRRKGSHGAGTYALPGGHLEFGEGFEQCGAREVLEETGIDLTGNLKSIQLAYATSDLIDGSKHYVTVFVRAQVPDDTEAQLLEPHKCDGWSWVPLSQIPEPRFPPMTSLLASPYRLQ